MPTMGNPTGKHRKKRRHHGEGTVVLRKDRWRAKPWAAVVPYTDASGRRREMWLSAASKAEAERLRDAEVKKLAKGIVRTEQTVAEYVNAWLETVEVGPGTWPRYRAHVTERIEPAFGDVALRLLTPQMVRSALIRWKGAPQTRGGTLRLLRAAMKQAVADRRIEHDPTAGIPYPRVARKDPVTLDSEQARRLIATVKGERFAPILIVSLGLGVRRGEALGLRTQDVDLDAGTVTIAKGLRYIPPTLRAPGEGPYRLTGTKTGETREVPLPAFVAEALRERLAERDIEQRAAKVWAANDFVFCSPVGNSVPLQTLYAWFKGALKRAGLPQMRYHDLRATTITLLLDMGVDLLTIQRIVGHRDLATTRRYVGKTPAAMTGAANRLEEAMGG
jgi:integrase